MCIKKMQALNPQELVLEQGIQLEIPTGADELEIEAIVEKTIEVPAATMVAEIQQGFEQATQQAMAPQFKEQLGLAAQQIRYDAQRLRDAPTQANLVKYKAAVHQLYQSLEGAKQYIVTEQAKQQPPRGTTQARGIQDIKRTMTQDGGAFDKWIERQGGVAPNGRKKWLVDSVVDFAKENRIIEEMMQHGVE